MPTAGKQKSKSSPQSVPKRTAASFHFISPLPPCCLPLCIINLHPICHEIPHLLHTQKGRLCLFFIWTVGDGARCLAAAECSGVTVPVTGHDEQPQMKDEAWRILGSGAPLDLLPLEYPRWRRGGKKFLPNHFLLESAIMS